MRSEHYFETAMTKKCASYTLENRRFATMKKLIVFIATISACLPIMHAPRAQGQMTEQTEQFDQRRRQMVTEQIAEPVDGRPPVIDARVLDAMRTVPRHRFVDGQNVDLAYIDRPLPIGHDQTISQPYIVAFMTELLETGPDQVVLEIGTGSGYQAAVLAELVRRVYTIEIVEPLAKEAVRTLDELNYDHVSVRAGDGYLGWPEVAPFDRIIVTAAPDHLPQPLIDQLKPGGRMVLPVGPVWSTQSLTLVTKDVDGKVKKRAVMAVGFVPLTRE